MGVREGRRDERVAFVFESTPVIGLMVAKAIGHVTIAACLQ